MEDDRIARLELELERLTCRVASLERPAAALAAPRVAAPPVAAPARRVQPAPEPVRRAPSIRERLGLAPDDRLEDLLGGRVLAWVGGLAVALGIVFLLAIAVSRGWIGEEARTALAALGSIALLLGGIRLHERTARSDAARAAVAAGVAGLFVTVTVATQVYELVPGLAGTMLAALVGATATALALRWSSRGIAALGILGAVAAPLLAGARPGAGTTVILLVAMVAATGVLLWQRWDWLALAAFAVGAPQWIAFLFVGDASPLATGVTLVAFGALGVAMAVGHDVRVRAPGLRSQPAFLLALNALVVAVAGWFAFDALGEPGMGTAWIACLSAAHVAVGLAGPGRARVSEELRRLALVLGVVLADVAFALAADGVVLALGWSAAGVAFAALLRRVAPGGRDDLLVRGGMAGHLALTLVTMLTVADPLGVLDGDAGLSVAGAASVAALAAACLAAGRLTGERGAGVRTALDGSGLAAIALLSALALDGTALALAWIAEALVLARVAHRAHDPVAGMGALGFLALATGHALGYEAPPTSLVTGLAAPLDAAAVVGGTAAVALVLSAWVAELAPPQRVALRGAAAVALLYLASGLVVTPFAEGDVVDLASIDAQQQGQMVLSVFWALAGLVALVVGLRRDQSALRVAALALLGVTAAKVFLVDLATLTSVYRVVSFVGFGLLLLAGAFMWQRLRPRREAPA